MKRIAALAQSGGGSTVAEARTVAGIAIALVSPSLGLGIGNPKAAKSTMKTT